MVFPIKTNIFNAGSPSQKYFARFPIQVAILFKPSDVIFTEYLKAEFANLHESTGENLAFFAVLDPPDEWLQDRSNSRWWRNYQATAGTLSFTTNEGPLIREIARLFGIPWHSLPAIVASTNLWQLEYVISPTSSEHLDVQLNELARLPDQYGIPNIGHIFTTLEAICSDQVDYRLQNESNRQGLRAFYNILNTFDTERGLEANDYRYELGRQLDMVENSLNSLRRNNRSQQFEDLDLTGIGSEDAVIEDATGRLIAPAFVAARVLQNLQNTVELPPLLNDESAVMIETSLAVGSFLESLAENALEGIGPLGRRRPQGGYGQNRNIQRPQPIDRNPVAQNPAAQRPQSIDQNPATQRPQPINRNPAAQRPQPIVNQNPAAQRLQPMMDIDFTPGAQGVWKAFELEVNLSMIQAARAARDITMPTYFTLHDPTLPQKRGIVETGHRGNRVITVDINQLDWVNRASGRHRFITLGDALHLVITMTNSPNERLDLMIQQAIGSSLSSRVIDAWTDISRIRNLGSHTHPLAQQDYEMVLQLALAPDVLGPLLEIKNAILQGRIQ